MIYEIFRWFGVITGYPIHLLFFKKKIYYEDKAVQSRKTKGGMLVISNHFSPFDYVLNVVLFFPRKLWVVASEYAFITPALRFGMKFFGGIETNRVTRGVHFIEESADKLRKGKLVQIFPEGHNTPDGTIKDFYPSYILIALQANAPILPVIIDGNYGIFKRTHVIIGKPIHPEDYLPSGTPTHEDIQQANTQIREKVLWLRQELDRRIAADKKKGKKA